MRFMFIVKIPMPRPPTPELIEAMHKLADREIKAGRMLDNGGLMPVATGAQVRIADGKLSVIDGPFVEAKEVIGGYAIFELRDKEEAVAMAKEFMQLHTTTCRAGKGRASFARSPSPLRRGFRPRRSAAMTAADVHRTILAVWRIEQPRLITSLSRMLRDVPLAEDLTQEALLAALEHWPASGVPEQPGAWLMATAKRRALDHLRRTKMLARKHEMVARDMEQEQQAMPDLDAALDDDIGDEMLRLIFTACHPLSVARGPRRAGAADDLRIDHGRDRPRLPGAGRDDRAAHRARQADAVGIRARLRDPARRRALRSGSHRCWRSSISSSTKAIPRRAATTGCVRSSATKRCASAAC